MKIKLTFISEEELTKLQPENQEEWKIAVPKIPLKKVFLVVIILGFIINQFLLWKMDYFSSIFKLFNVNIVVTKK